MEGDWISSTDDQINARDSVAAPSMWGST